MTALAVDRRIVLRHDASLMTSASRRPSPIAWLIAPALLLFLLFFVLPFAVMAVMSFYSSNPISNPHAHMTTRHYMRFIADSAGIFHDALWETLRIGAVTTVASLLIGYPLAHWMARLRSRLAYALALMAVITPLLTGIVVRTFAWMTILQDKGVINTTLIDLGLIQKPLPLMYNEFGTVVALVHIFVPFMVLTLIGVIGRIDERLEQAARSLGAGRVRAFAEVTLPLSLPGVLAGSLLVFALSISSYVTPTLMGGTRVLTLPMLIAQQLGTSFNPNFAGALGVILLSVSLVIVIAYNRIVARLAGEQGLA
jgi:putative spermidine/putrescine transport system permease protein